LVGDDYDKSIVDTSGKFISDRPHFITFINSNTEHSNIIRASLEHLAHYYQGDIQFWFTNAVLDDKLAYTYEVYSDQEGAVPRSILIDTDGKAYTFPHVFPSVNVTTNWIDYKKYKSSPFQFKALARMSDMKL